MDQEESMWNALNSFNWKNGKVNYALTASELYSFNRSLQRCICTNRQRI